MIRAGSTRLRCCLLILAPLLPLAVSAQNVGINVNGATPHASALLDVDASGLPANGKRGMLIPRMTTAERAAIPAPATSALVYDTTTNGFWYFDGTVWIPWALVGSAWRITGNAGLTAGTHFIGTTDAANVQLRANNVRAGHLADGITSFGVQAGIALGTGHTAFGYQAAMALNTSTSVRNTAVGHRVMPAFNSANNTAVGSDALLAVTLGLGQNTAVGHLALGPSNLVNDLVAVGHRAEQGGGASFNNTSVGAQANANCSGEGGIGYQAGLTGGFAVGSGAGGDVNGHAFGAGAGRGLAFGYYALDASTSGVGLIAMGYLAMPVNTSGNYNTAVGARSLFNSLGGYNTAIGNESLSLVGSGSSNTGLGAFAGPTITTLDYTTAIGYNSVPTANGRIVFGTTLSNNLTGGYGAWQNASDARFKREVRADVPGIELIGRLRPVTYNVDAPAIERFTGAEARLARLEDPVPLREHQRGWNEVAKERCTGLLAQEVEQALDSLGADLDILHRPANEVDHYTLSYAALVVPLVRTVQQQQERLAVLRASNRALVEQLEALERAGSVTPEPRPTVER